MYGKSASYGKIARRRKIQKVSPGTVIQEQEDDAYTVVVNVLIRSRYLSDDPRAMLGLMVALDSNAKLWTAKEYRLRELASAVKVLSKFVSPLLKPYRTEKPARKQLDS